MGKVVESGEFRKERWELQPCSWVNMNISVDAKGRLFVPAKLRSELGKTFVITKGVDGCIDVYPWMPGIVCSRALLSRRSPRKSP